MGRETSFLICSLNLQERRIDMEFYTLGVYHSSEQQFFQKLQDNAIDLFWDIRRRRGVRGSKYAFVNKTRLIQRLHEFGIDYKHSIELSPTSEIRNIQKSHDNKINEKKSERTEMCAEFIDAYTRLVLDRVDMSMQLKEIQKSGKQRIALFCVEQTPQACHRSIVTARLEQMGYKTNHL